jgi:hypothetical protein
MTTKTKLLLAAAAVAGYYWYRRGATRPKCKDGSVWKPATDEMLAAYPATSPTGDMMRKWGGACFTAGVVEDAGTYTPEGPITSPSDPRLFG